jgi:hypothetical protein
VIKAKASFKSSTDSMLAKTSIWSHTVDDKIITLDVGSLLKIVQPLRHEKCNIVSASIHPDMEITDLQRPHFPTEQYDIKLVNRNGNNCVSGSTTFDNCL